MTTIGNGLENQDAIKRAMCKQSLYFFLQEFWGEVSATKPVLNWHIQYLCEELEIVARRLFKFENGNFYRPKDREPKLYDLLINICPGATKCVCADTKIFTDKGFVNVQDIQNGDFVYSHDKGKLFKQAIVATAQYDKPCVEIETKLHNTLKVSYDHPVLTHKGWKFAGELNKDDFLISLCSEMDGSTPINEAELDFITLMLFEGGVTEGSRRFTSADKEVVDVMKKACDKLGFTIANVNTAIKSEMQYRITCGRKDTITKLLKKYGICDKLAIDKELPVQFFTMPLHQKYRFISLMLATDGYIVKNKGGFGVCLGSSKLAKDILYLLMSCGIPATYRYRNNGFAGEHRVAVNGYDAKKLLGKIDCLQKQKEFIKIFDKKRYALTHGYPREVLKGLSYKMNMCKPKIHIRTSCNVVTDYAFSRLLELSPSLEKWKMQDFIYDKVLAVKEIGTQTVYHLQTESTEYDKQNFIANGIVTHNSTIVSQMFPAWCWVNDPTLRFMSGSYSGTLALEQADYTREIIRSAKFKRLFPEIQFRADAENKTNYKIEWFKQNEYGEMERQRGGNRLSCSPSGTATGFHADIIIIDDPINPNDANSATGVGLYNACDWIKSTLSTRKTEKDKTVFIMVMQRLNEADPSGMWIQEAKEGKRKIKHICLPGELTENVSPPALRKFYKDGLFDPVRLNRKVLEEQYNNLGPYGYAGQILQTPVPIGEGLFKVEKFEIVSSIQESDILEKIRYWDKAGTEGAGAFSVGVLFAKLKSGKFALLDIIRGQWSTEKRENIIKQTAQLDGKSVKIYIEQEGGSGGKESAEATIRNLAGYMVFIDLPKGDKTTRAIPYSVQVNSGNVILVANQWNRDYINECRHFPLGKYKDQVDASSAAFNMLFQEKRAGVWGSRNNHK